MQVDSPQEVCIMLSTANERLAKKTNPNYKGSRLQLILCDEKFNIIDSLSKTSE